MSKIICELLILSLVIGLGVGKVKNGQRHVPITTWQTIDGKPTTFFAHRGEKVLLPEHTIAAYRVAAILGADFVEPDLCLTKDDHLVCHHDLFLKDTTDVETRPEFEHLRQRMGNGEWNWFVRDFTLNQLKTLRLNQKHVGIRPGDFDGFFRIPTFVEFLQAMEETGRKLNKSIAIAPELKDPSYHNEGKSKNFMENQLIKMLNSRGYYGSWNCSFEKCPQIVVQSFEFEALEYLKNTTKFQLLMLADDDLTLLTYGGLEKVARVADFYCVWKEYLHVGVETYLKFIKKKWDPDVVKKLGGFVPAQEFTKVAHRLGMKMVVYTIHDSREPSRRGCAYVGKGPICDAVRVEDKTIELNFLFKLGVDGVFIENLVEGREIRNDFQNKLNIIKLTSTASKSIGQFSLICTIIFSLAGFIF